MENHKALYTKLLAIQNELKPIVKDETNPFYKSKYFDINGLIAALRPVLKSHGVVVLQPLVYENERLGIQTIVADPESGEELSKFMPITETDDAQKMGAIITYFRRYALTSFFLLEAEDDDGNSTVGLVSKTPAEKPELSKAGVRRKCLSCGDEFNPKPGTENYAKQCLACYKAKKPLNLPPKIDPKDIEPEEIPY